MSRSVRAPATADFGFSAFIAAHSMANLLLRWCSFCSTLRISMTKELTKEEVWTVEDAENLYRVKLWGESYFYVNEEGHLAVRPILGDPIGIDVHKVVQGLRQQR